MYLKNKRTYEMELITTLLKKYKESLKPNSKIQLETEIYYKFESETKALLAEYASNKKPSEIKCKEFKIKAREHLKTLIQNLKREYNSKNPETTVPDNYNEWKNKLCELVNVWDLFTSNGLKVRIPFKYILLKKFFIKRSTDKQKNNTSNSKSDDYDLNLSRWEKIKIMFGIGVKDDSANLLPRGIVKGDGGFKSFLHFIMFFLIVYTVLTMPLLYIMQMKMPLLSALEKIISAFFFIDLILTFRTAIKDKANNWVYQIDTIGNGYIYSSLVFDAISSIPFNLFFSQCSISLNQSLRFIRSLVRLARINQIFPFISMCEKIRSITAIIKLLKLVFTYLLIAHWLANIIYAVIDDSIDYGNMEKVCYYSTNTRVKKTLKPECMWLIGMYNASYLLIGQYTSFFQVYETLNPSIEYCIMIFGYLIGQFMVAFVYGGVATIILNLNQAQNFFSSKVDMLNDHMNFYEVDGETQNDVRTFYNYLWQRHKDIIYSKSHFDLLTESLREKFEQLNLPTNEAYLGKFYKLSNNNKKMIGQILTNLKKSILYPYEILYEERSVTKGLYILINGQVEMCCIQISNMPEQVFKVNYAEVIKIIEKQRKDKKNGVPNIKPIWSRDDLSIVFPLLSCLTKTGRNWQRCYTKDFTDLLYLPLKAFDELVFNFPVEMHVLKHDVMHYIDKSKLFDNYTLFKIISAHSSKSTGSYYEKEYTKHNLWIPIPIPISQRKIAKNYFASFILKVKNQYREIITSGDINICLNGFNISNCINKEAQTANPLEILEAEEKESKKKTNLDPVEGVKDKSKNLMKLIDLVVDS